MYKFLTRNYHELIQPNKAWEIIDPSKLNEFQSCERKFFFRYVLGWTPVTNNIHFIFGTSWHLAMEYLKKHGVTEENIEPAFDLFIKYYREFYDPITDPDQAPKNPSNALHALEEYVETHKKADKEYETLYTEIFATVPINSEGRVMSGRMDAILRHNERGITGVDFKTSSRRSQMWEGQWKTSLQMSFYYHVLNITFPDELIYGMLVDGMFFYKRQQKDVLTKNIPVRVPVRKTDEMHQAFLSDANYLIDMLEWNFEGLEKASPDDTVLSAFPRRSNTCTSYNQLCPYHALCTSWGNPLKHCKVPPIGMKVSHWNPKEDETKPSAKTILDGGEFK